MTYRQLMNSELAQAEACIATNDLYNATLYLCSALTSAEMGGMGRECNAILATMRLLKRRMNGLPLH